MTEIRSRFVRTDGFRTHYTESGGDGPAIVAMHGGGAGSSGEAGMAPLIRALPDRFRVIAPDSVGGFGKTDAHAPAPYGLHSRVDHLESVVEALCLDRFTLLGNSQGAWVAARYAALHPEKVERMILIGSATISSAMGLPDEPTPAMAALFNYDGTREAMRKVLESLVYNKSIVTEELIDLRQNSAARPGAMDAFRAAVKAQRDYVAHPVLRQHFDMRAVLPALTKAIPTIVIWGENDDFAPVHLGRAVEKMLPDAKFHYVDTAGHQVQNDQPDLVGKIVTAFMG
jgi:pimeloyl-ACP methyl ester carboxylesterase